MYAGVPRIALLRLVRRPFQELGQTEIDELGNEVESVDLAQSRRVGGTRRRVEDDVAGLEVSMDHTMVMRVVDGGRQSGDQVDGHSKGGSAAIIVQPFGETLAGAVFLGDVPDRPPFARFKHTNQIRMVERSGSLCLAQESTAQLRADEGVGSRDLQCDFPPEHRVNGQKDNAEAPPPELAHDLKPADAGQRARVQRSVFR